MSGIRVLLAGALLLFMSTVAAHAASDDFTVRTLVGNDTTPPSAPQNLMATPVAISQIDLLWSTSTDNLAVSGYQVFRRPSTTTAFSQIATTSVPNYSDTGLAASTTYYYYVTAFDTFNNISASSTVATGTTFAIPPPSSTSTPPGDTQTGTKIPFELTKLEIISERTTATLRYTTRGHMRTVVRWGESASYELGSLQEATFRRGHETVITGLSPGTTYHVVIEGENSAGTYGPLTSTTFTTLLPDDVFPPGNVRNLHAKKDGDDVVLTWQNPTDTDFSHVRVIRNDRFYPSDPADGWLVYEGDNSLVLDEGAMEAGAVQYYTVFAYDRVGNISSGAVVRVTATDTTDEIPTEEAEDGGITSEPTDGSGTSTDRDEEGASLDFVFSDIEFVQDGEILPQSGGSVSVSGAKRLTVRIPFEKMPRHLKTITIEVESNTTNENSEPSSESFLLRINEAETYYTTTLSAFSVNGRFPITVSVFDFETEKVASATGIIVSTITYEGEKEEKSGGFIGYLFSLFDSETMLQVSYGLLFLLLLLLLLVALRQSTRQSTRRSE